MSSQQQSNTNNTTSNSSSNNNNNNVESLLTPMQEVLDAWSEEEYEICSQKCLFILKKRKQAMISSQETTALLVSIQRVLLQCWLHLEQYSKIHDWIQSNDKTNNNHNGLSLYANYRSEQYDKVSKSSVNNNSNNNLLEQHLLAQSYFHLNQSNTALKQYKDILAKYDNDNDEDDGDDDKVARMEVLSNALAVITSTAVPFLPVNSSSSDDWIEKSETFLNNESQQQETTDDDDYDDYEDVNLSDLAFNLGTLQFLESSNPKTNWLEFAEDNFVNEEEDLPPIQTNSAWCDHFWYTDDIEDISYNTDNKSSSPRAAVANFNQSLLDGKSVPTQPHPKWNLLQIRMYWYNRALSQYKGGKIVECQESCQSLKKTLLGGGDSSMKKKQSSDCLWWETRADVLIAYAQQKQEGKGNKGITKLEQRLEYLKGQKPSSMTLDHAIAHVQLHLYQLQQQQQQQSSNNNNKQIRKVLKSLPESIQSCAAVEATFNSIGGRDGPEEQQQSKNNNKTANDKSPEDQALALFGQGKYKESAELYSKTLPSPSKSNEDQLAHHLWYVQALSRSNQHVESDNVWKEIQPLLEGSIDEGSVEGESLEQKALPRSSTSTSSSNNAKNIIGTTTTGTQKPKRSNESVLRQRAKRREAYLKQLEAKGEYNPDRPTKPNPERWIPKHERSRGGGGGRRGRHQQQQHRGAQGGGSQADAQRLDAAARRAGNYNPSNSGPSTANMKAVGGGGGKRRGRR